MITKHPGTGGAVTVETVTAQLLYEIGGPRYLGPDVTSRFDTITLTQDGAGPGADHRRAGRGTAGHRRKVCMNTLAGFRNSATFVLCGLDIDAKAELARRQLTAEVGDGRRHLDPRPHRPRRRRHRGNRQRAAARDDHDHGHQARQGFLPRLRRVGAGVLPRVHTHRAARPTAPRSASTGRISCPSSEVPHIAVLPGGERADIAAHAGRRHAPTAARVANTPNRCSPGQPAKRRSAPILGARSGDKGGDANLGVWARTDDGYRWLADELTTDRLRELLPEAEDLDIERHPLPNLRAVNFVVHGLLGEGVAASTRFDPQAKALGEWLRSRVVDVPEVLL